jgi:hypothetical protein
MAGQETGTASMRTRALPACMVPGPVKAQMGNPETAGLGVKRPRRLAVGQDFGADRRFALDPDLHQTLAKLGLVLHPRGDFLTDIAALAEVDAVQPFEPGFQDIGVVRNQFDAAFRDDMGGRGSRPSRQQSAGSALAP